MSSLIRPRKIGMIDDTGVRHYFLCKPKDDLRKDTRLMEFNALINKLLKKKPESRKRQLCMLMCMRMGEGISSIEVVPHPKFFLRCSDLCCVTIE